MRPPVRRYFQYHGTWSDDTTFPSGIYFTDGSGGADHDVPQLRRCGIGVCDSPPTDPLSAPNGLNFPLPGDVQTVPRAEMSAVLTVAQRAQHGANITVYSDNQLVVKQYNNTISTQSLNQDLLVQIRDNVRLKELNFSVIWIKAHLSPWDPTTWPPGTTFSQVIGNYYADRYAGVGAERAQLPADLVGPIRQYINLTYKIQRRLATILTRLPKRANRPPNYLNLPKSSLLPYIHTSYNSQHVVHETQGRLHCCYCRASVPTRSRAETLEWLSSKCICTSVRIGNKYTHHSHNIRSLKGIIFCTKCGLLASQQLKGLAKECQAPTAHYAKPHAKVNLRRLARGILPHGYQYQRVTLACIMA